ncbi:MAG TPA: hypothetical protein VGK73_32405 [Polyangiaceae bacterium]
MPTLHACADGAFTTAATWGVVNATALLDSQAANTVLTTAFVSSAVFAPGAITIDGIAVKIASRAATPNGTMSVRLFNSTGAAAVAGTTVTINVSDIPDDIGTPGATFQGCSIGWFFFKFSAPVTLLAATNYTVQATTSVATQVNLFRDGTAGNWSRMLRTTTTAAPGAGDNWFVGGEWTAAGTKTNRSVTMDGTGATDYGGGSTTLASFGVSKGGTLLAPTGASTAYNTRLSGVLMNWLEGVLDLGGTTRVPTGSSFQIEFDCAADGEYGLMDYGSFSSQGSPRTSGKEVVRTLLTADVAAAGSSLTVADDTGWLNGDAIAIAGTLAATQSETATLNANAGASSLSLSAGLTNAHDGDAPNETQADVILLTRNVVITSVSASFFTYIAKRAGSWTAKWTEFKRVGTSTSGKEGWSVDQNSTSGTWEFCSFNITRTHVCAPTTNGLTMTLTDCVTWRIGDLTQGFLFNNNNSPLATLTRCTILGTGATSNGGFFVGGASAVVQLDGVNMGCLGAPSIRVDAGVVYARDSSWYFTVSSSGAIINNSGTFGSRYIRCRFWRCTGTGVVLLGGSSEWIDCEFYGNSSRSFEGIDGVHRVVNTTFNGQTSFSGGAAIRMTSDFRITFDNCRFGVVAGDRTALSTFAIDTNNQRIFLTLVMCDFNGTQFNGTPAVGSIVAQQDEDAVVATHVTRHYGFGTARIETATFGDASPALKLTPEHRYRAFRSQLFTKQINSGQTATFTAKVRKSAAYNGNNPRLVLVANGSIDIETDTVLSTLSVAADTWETLTGAMSAAASQDGVCGVWVECDGDAGDIFVDDITVSVA